MDWTAPDVTRREGSLVAPERETLPEHLHFHRTTILDVNFDDSYSLRLIYLHVMGEHARHNGHADMVRERLDGITGF